MSHSAGMMVFCGLGVGHQGVLRRAGSIGWSCTAWKLGTRDVVSVGGAGGSSSACLDIARRMERLGD